MQKKKLPKPNPNNPVIKAYVEAVKKGRVLLARRNLDK